MKKVMGSVFIAVFLLVAFGVSARQDNDDIDISKLLEGKGIKLEKKQFLSKEERVLGEKSLKGASANSSGKNKPTQTVGATGVLGAPMTSTANKYAVVIGLSNYIGTASDLCVTKTAADYDDLCRDGDSLNMGKALVEKHGYSAENVKIFTDASAKSADIRASVDNIVANAKPGDEVIFFFSGHSATSSGNVDGDKESIDEGIVLYDGTTIWDGVLKNWFSGLQTNRAIFVFDTCKAGGMNDLQADGRVLALSSSETQYSYTYYLGGEVGQIGEGMFTHYFVNEGMYAGLADGYNALNKIDASVAVEEALGYSKKFVPVMTANRQIPTLNDMFANDLLLGYFQ